MASVENRWYSILGSVYFLGYFTGKLRVIFLSTALGRGCKVIQHLHTMWPQVSKIMYYNSCLGVVKADCCFMTGVSEPVFLPSQSQMEMWSQLWGTGDIGSQRASKEVSTGWYHSHISPMAVLCLSRRYAYR